jgi:hypothetical protein
MAAFLEVITPRGSGPALTAYGSLDLKQENQIQIQSQSGALVSSRPTMAVNWREFFAARAANCCFLSAAFFFQRLGRCDTNHQFLFIYVLID